jgi:hypothetical protein
MKSYKALEASMVLTTLVLSCFPQLATAQGNLVFNGSFDTDASGWTITDISSGGGYISSAGNPPGSVFLYNLSIPTIPTASQVINSLTPGDLYIVSGDYQGAGGKDVTENSFGVALDSVFLFETAAPADHNWYNFNFEYTATSTRALLSLEAQINGLGAYSYYIDNISMEAVPEPNSLCLIGIGGIISAMFFRSRRKIWLQCGHA